MELLRKKQIDLSDLERSEISRLIDRYGGLIFHEIALNRIVSETYNTELYYYLLKDDSGIRSCSPVHYKRRGLIGTYEFKALYDIPYGGFLEHPGMNIPDALKQLRRSPFKKYFYQSVPITAYDPEERYATNKRIKFKETLLIDLSQTEDEIWKNHIHSKRRNMIRKAMKFGITVKTFNTMEGFDDFWPILLAHEKRLHNAHVDEAYFRRILRTYLPENKARIFMAYEKGVPISGILLIGNAHMMHYWKGASVGSAPNLGQGELLQWEAIKWAKNNGSAFYDLCVVDKEKLPNLYEFKTGFSKDITRFYSYTNFNVLYLLGVMLKHVFKK